MQIASSENFVISDNNGITVYQISYKQKGFFFGGVDLRNTIKEQQKETHYKGNLDTCLENKQLARMA